MGESTEIRWGGSPAVPSHFTRTLAFLLAIGVVAFPVGLAIDPPRAWEIYLVNFLFWTGLAQGAVVFAAVYHVVRANWGPPVRRLAEGMVTFLPVSLVLFVPLFFGLNVFFARVHELNPGRGAWFDPLFIFVRSGLGLGLITVLSVLFVYHSLRVEAGFARERGVTPTSWLQRSISDGWQGSEVEIPRSRRAVDVFAPTVLLAYPVVYSVMAFELVMALDPFWYSSLFGGYFFVGTFYLGLAGVTIVTVLAWRRLGIDAITPSQLSDLGKLLFGFALTYMAMVWSQYLVIWYGNLPEETHFVVERVWRMPWAPISWTVLTGTFIVPLVVLLSRRIKEKPGPMLFMGILIATALWLERFVLVVPSIWTGKGVPFGWLEVGVTAGFAGAVGLSYVFFLRSFPVHCLAGQVMPRLQRHGGQTGAVESRPAHA